MDGLPNAPQIPMPQVPLSPKPFLKTPLGLILIALGAAALIGAALFSLKNLNINLPIKQVSQQLQTQPEEASSPASLTAKEQPHVNKAAQDLVNNYLQPQYQAPISLKESKFTVNNETVPLPNYLATWEADSVSNKLSLQYDFTNRKILSIDLTMEVPHTISTVSSSSITEILSAYIQLKDQFKFSCTEANAIGNIQCHSMVTNQDESRLGISFQTNTASTPDNKTDMIYICQNFAGSNTYSWSSCLHE